MWSINRSMKFLLAPGRSFRVGSQPCLSAHTEEVYQDLFRCQKGMGSRVLPCPLSRVSQQEVGWLVEVCSRSGVGLSPRNKQDLVKQIVITKDCIWCAG